jgi:hypothetical protein
MRCIDSSTPANSLTVISLLCLRASDNRDSGVMTSMEFQPSLLTRSLNLGPTAGMLSVSTPGSRQHPGFGTGSMSLTDAYFSSGRQSHSQVPLSLRQSVQQRYLTGEGSEYDLLDRVQRRVASRMTNEVSTSLHSACTVLVALFSSIVVDSYERYAQVLYLIILVTHCLCYRRWRRRR